MMLLIAALAMAAQPPEQASLESQSLAEVAAAIERGALTSERLTTVYLERIETIDDAPPVELNSIIAVNPNALAEARARDAAARRSGALRGVPILIKDNIETQELPTTAGSLALRDNRTGRDAPLVTRLRAAGAVILGKANLSEWANFRDTRSVSGWSALGGLVRNPHALARNACGSSSGSASAVAAGLAAAAIGTETDGSIVCPASVNGVVGLKPTVGLVSRTHIIPISASQDTAGPVTRTVRDAAIVLSVIAGSDPADPATAEADARKLDYAAELTPGALRGVRIGVLRDRIGDQPGTRAAFDKALTTLQRAGAVLVDIGESRTGLDGVSAAEFKVLLTEFKAGFNAYLASTSPGIRTRTLRELIDFNKAEAAREMPWFGQDIFEQAEATTGLDHPAYKSALETSRRLARGKLDALLATNRVAMLTMPTTGPAWLSDPINGDQYDGPSASALPAIAGYPHLTVPAGRVRGMPVGLSLVGPAWSEAALLRAGHAFEQARGPLPPPAYRASVTADGAETAE